MSSDVMKAQIEDAQLHAIIEFLKTKNATLFLIVNDAFQKTVLQSRCKYSERGALACTFS